jgi:alpha-N-arabinofuranosidase
VVNAGSDTFPVDIVAAWTRDHHALTVAVLNPTDVEQPLKLSISGAALSGEGVLWRLASAADNGRNPAISNSPLNRVPETLALPRFSITIYELAAR